MELLQLKYFLILCESQHVPNRRKAQHIPTLSQFHNQMKLEKELGVPLFVLQRQEFGTVSIWSSLPGICPGGLSCFGKRP